MVGGLIELRKAITLNQIVSWQMPDQLSGTELYEKKLVSAYKVLSVLNKEIKPLKKLIRNGKVGMIDQDAALRLMGKVVKAAEKVNKLRSAVESPDEQMARVASERKEEDRKYVASERRSWQKRDAAAQRQNEEIDKIRRGPHTITTDMHLDMAKNRVYMKPDGILWGQVTNLKRETRRWIDAHFRNHRLV